METTTALILTAYIVPVNLIDNILRPIIFARGLKTPMLVIIVGVIGGTLSNGADSSAESCAAGSWRQADDCPNEVAGSPCSIDCASAAFTAQSPWSCGNSSDDSMSPNVSPLAGVGAED